MAVTTEEKKFTKSNDEITINKDSGKDVSIKSLSDKSSDKLVFGTEYTKKFAYEKSGKDLVIKYDEKGADEQTVTISGYFTKDGNSKSSLKTIKIGETEKSITELYKNVVTGSKGTMFDDTITSSEGNDKMYGLGGNNTYIFGTAEKPKFGNDTVYATGKQDTLTFAKDSKLTYTLKGNDVVVTVADKEGENATELGTVTIKDALKSEKNVSIKVGETEKGLEDALKDAKALELGNADSQKALTIKGTVLSDTITGSAKNDKIYTGAGNDTITAGKGNDTINITGAGEKTIKISDFDGNDVITGIAKADKVKLNFTSVDTTVDYSKSGNNLVATREFYKKLDGAATTDVKSTENAKQMYVDKDGKLTTEAEGNKAITGNLYQSADGKYSITKDDTFTSQVYLDKDGKLTTEAEGNTAVNKLYEKDINYTMSETYEHANELVKETTTIKDYFKDSKNAGKLDGVTNVAVSGKGKLVGGFTNDTITSSAKNDKMYGLGGNNTYIFNADVQTKFGNDTVYATGDKDILTFAKDSELTYTLKGNDVVVSVADKKGEGAKTLGTVTIKDALKSEKNVSIKVGETEKGLEDALKDAKALELGNADSQKALTIKGTVFNDVITGSAKNDKIYTGAGDDVITAGKGNDVINITGAGNKTINIANGDGNDVITGIAKADKVTLSGLTEGNLSYRKSGNDLVITREEEAATKEKEAVTATTTIKDYFKDSKNADRLAGVTVKDVAVTGKGKIVGSFGNDVITGSAKADKIYTGAGVDTITAGKGNDTINITGAGKKTINIANHDGNDVITGVRTDGASVDLKINEGDTLSYSKNGASNDLIITRKYTEQLTNKKGEKLYTDVVTGKQTTATTVAGSEITDKDAKFWQKDGKIITDAQHTAIGNKAQEGYTEITTKTYQKGEEAAITEEAFGKLSEEEKNSYTEIITKTYKKGNAEAISEVAYKELAKAGYTEVSGTVYSYGSGKKLTYSTDATKANTALTKDYTETTTVKDFFKDGEGASNVTVNGKGITDNIYNISTVKKHAEQKIVDSLGNDTYNVDNKFDFRKDKLIISDTTGDNDVLNLVKNADDLTILFDIKKEGESAVGDALYVIGKGQTNLDHGIQMEGIDKVKTADGDVTAPANEIVQAVQGWLGDANSGKGYDSVADAIKANDADLANLIAKFAPSQPQA